MIRDNDILVLEIILVVVPVQFGQDNFSSISALVLRIGSC